METRIDLYMKNLGISREEAIALITDDANDVSVELSKEQAEVVKEMTRTTGDKDKRKTTRKSDADKRLLVSVLHGFLHDFLFASQDHLHCEIINPEREIQFKFRGALYKLILSKPRVKE